MLNSVLAISAGAALGAVLRWLMSNSFNALFPELPPGTLLANLVGGYLIGVAAAVFVLHPGISTEWRQFVVTGLLGGLTTFSTFSLEVIGLLQLQRFGWAAAAVVAHVAGSLLMTALGFASVALLRRAA
jgi:CrcB protein